MTKRIVWIASYPKSGNTWMRFMVGNLLFGRQSSAAALAVLVPDIHEMSEDAAGALTGGLVKTHFPFSSRLCHGADSRAAVYIVRDPADVLVSNFFYAQRSAPGGTGTNAGLDAYFDGFLEHRGDPRWCELGMGTWEENVRSWLDPAVPFPVLRLRYEDMIEDPLAACRALAALVKPGSSETEIREAVGNSSFQRMREVERADIRDEKVGIFYKPYLQPAIAAGSRFMRRGIVGDGAARLSVEQRRALRGAFGPLLRELGYPTD